MSEPLGKDQIIFSSVIISIVLGFIICIIPHFDTSNYNYVRSNNYINGYYYNSDKVSYATYKCGLGERHELKTENITVSDLNTTQSNNIIADAFDHFLLMLIIAIVSTIIISVLWIRSEDEEKFKEIK